VERGYLNFENNLGDLSLKERENESFPLDVDKNAGEGGFSS